MTQKDRSVFCHPCGPPWGHMPPIDFHIDYSDRSLSPSSFNQAAVYETVKGGLLKYLMKRAIPSPFLLIVNQGFWLSLTDSDSFLTELALSLTL